MPNRTIILTRSQLRDVKLILERYFPNKTVWVFGSRAGTNRVKEFSDLDLAIDGLSAKDDKNFSMLKYDFEDSDLPFKVDVVDLNGVDANFKSLILNNSIVIK